MPSFFHGGTRNKGEGLSSENFFKLYVSQSNAHTEAFRIANFANFLDSASPAEEWFDNLPTADTTTWAAFDAAFHREWPKPIPTRNQRTENVVHKEMEEDILTLEKFSGRETLNGQEMSGCEAWSKRMMERATTLKVKSTTHYIYGVRTKLPTAIRDRITANPADWTAFLREVEDVSPVYVLEQMEKDQEIQKEKESIERKITEQVAARVAALNAAPQPESSAMRALRERMDRMLVSSNPPMQYSNSGYSLNSPPNPPPQYGGGGPSRGRGGGYAGYGQSRGTTAMFGPPSNHGPPAPIPSRDTLLANVGKLVHHPATDEGRLAHIQQVVAWKSLYGENGLVNKNRPYPLTPGTSPANNFECWKCGNTGHIAPACTNSQLPMREQDWRRAVFQGLRPPAVSTPMQFATPYYDQQQHSNQQQYYNQQQYSNQQQYTPSYGDYYNAYDQGNGGGPAV
jgi:hypothetical protein